MAGACAVAQDAGDGRVRAPDAGAGALVVPGAVDPSFGQRGIVALPVPGVEPRGMVVAPDGTIVIVGSVFVDATSSFEGYVFRLLGDGSLDASFDGGGVHRIAGRNVSALSVALGPTGEIVVGGACDCEPSARIWRLRPDGSPDPGFASGGELALDAEAAFIDNVSVEPDGAIRALGLAMTEGLYAARVLGDGRLDHGGVVPVGDFILHAATPGRDGSWILGGAVDTSPEDRGRTTRTTDLARIAPDGTLDLGFGSGGFVALDADDLSTAVIVGDRVLLGLGRYDDEPTARSRVEARLADGRLDEGFGQGGATDLGRAANVFAILAHADGALEVVAGDERQLAIHRRRAGGAALGEPWRSSLPDRVWLDHLAVALDPRSGDLLAAAIQHHRVLDAAGTPWWRVAGTGLFRVPR